MENFIIYYILNVLIWGVFLRHQLFIKPDIRESIKNISDLSEDNIDANLFMYWFLLTVFWPVTILLSFVLTLFIIFRKK